MAAKRKEGLQISWTTIRYRSIAGVVAVLILVVCFVLYLLFPAAIKSAAGSFGDALLSVAAKLGITSPSVAHKNSPVGPQQAHFTNIEGAVKVKKASANTWINADYNLPLDRGDVIQTTSEGLAKIVFADGTSYTVKQDSLIVIEDNSVNTNQQTQVAVQVTTGTVDLSTATFSQGSRSQVVVAGATASLSPESSAQVVNDPRADQHQILIKKGSGEVTRGTETLRLGDYEMVSFKNDSTTMTKTKELGPPTLIGPPNMAPIFTAGQGATVQLSWTPVSQAVAYRVRISRNPYFSSTVLDSKTKDPDLNTQLDDGAYYWSVQAMNATGKTSVESERNRFTVISKGAEKVVLPLTLGNFVQHGHVIEVRGKTEPNARVMVNGQEVPAVNSDGSFIYLTPPLPSGENVITVTAQNSRGAVNTQQRKIVIQ